MAANSDGDAPSATERRNSARVGAAWTQAERDRFIAELREARQDAQAVTIQAGDVVPNSQANGDRVEKNPQQ